MNKQLEKKIHEIALENGLTDKQTLDIFKSQFEFIKEKMQESRDSSPMFPVITLPKFAKFIPTLKYRNKRKAHEQQYPKQVQQRRKLLGGESSILDPQDIPRIL